MRIDNDVLEVLSVATIDGAGVRLADQLDRKLYVKTAKVIEAAGAKWNRGRKMHIFLDHNAGDKIEQAILTGQITTRQEIDFFPTPDPIIDMMLEAADLLPEHTVLEPSAGCGAIAARVQGAGAKRLVCVEKDVGNLEALRIRLKASRGTMQGDFLELNTGHLGDFDRILMNPPFKNLSDQAHIRHAFNFLKPGGRLVSIASPGMMFRQDNKTKAFRQWLEGQDYDIHDLPEGSFRSSGTMVNTVLLTMDRP